MELEWGLKLNRVVDGFSSTEFKFAKDRGGPVFFSTETDSMFILTLHLKGFTKQNLKIGINEDGTLIAITGEKQVQGTVLKGWKMYKKDKEIKGFKKVFRIPDEVILDKINANFSEDESILTISMPKKVKGIRGTGIEEVEEQSLVEEVPEILQNVDEEIPGNDQESEPGKMVEKDDEPEILTEADGVQSIEEHPGKEEIHRVETEMTEELENQELKHDKVLDDAESSSLKQMVNEDQQEKDRVHENENENENGIQEEEEVVSAVIKQPEMAQESKPGKMEEKPPGKRCSKMCIPVVAGSALILSLVVFVIQLIRTKNQESRRKN
ncbi:SHSP domain-containing protein [Abeliophyllum distichum]|uniref:SHSP domain-containing protein n=1 Tax=Abeliophyllum distichum TaxID=126358 RepID=A0ABD1SSK9_9LAMI